MKKLSKDKNFKNRLRSLLEEKLNIKQVEFCKKLDITQGYLSMILAGSRGPSADLIAGLYIHYSEYMDWIITGSKIKKENEDIPISTPFKDQPRADRIINNLARLEHSDPTRYAKTEGYIEAQAESLPGASGEPINTSFYEQAPALLSTKKQV